MSLKVGMMVVIGGHRFRVGLSLAFGLFAASAAPADESLFPAVQYDTGVRPESVAIGDLRARDKISDAT